MSTSCPQGQGIDAASLQILWILPALVDVCPWNKSLSLERKRFRTSTHIQHQCGIISHLKQHSPAQFCCQRASVRENPGEVLVHPFDS